MSSGIYALAIPKWGIEMENGTVTQWHHNVGDNVTQGEELVDIESDKIMNTLDATATGVLRRVLLEVGDTLGVGELIGIIADAEASEDAIDSFINDFNSALGKSKSDSEAVVAESSAAIPEAATATANTKTTNTKTKVRVSPPVRRLAEKLGVDIGNVTGSGPNGRITSVDVEAAASGSDAREPAAIDAQSDDEYTSIALTTTKQTIARRLVESKQSVPHFYLNVDIVLDALLAKRATINAEQSQKVSINDLIVWCTARALVAVPQINAQLVGDEVRQFKHADISVAVATERGLLTPIIRAAETMTPVEISVSTTAMIEKAKGGGLERNDIVGGSFTLSNLGMYGVSSFDAIINPPQVAILALGKAQKQVLATDDDETRIATVLTASLSCDHRVVDGALGGKFLSALKQEVESL